jgi:hypothetical protein
LSYTSQAAKDKTIEALDVNKQKASDENEYVKECFGNPKQSTSEMLQAGKDYVKESAQGAKDSFSDNYNQAKEYIKNSDTVGKMQKNVEGAMESFDNTYSQTKDYISDKNNKASEKVSDMSKQAKESTGDMYNKSKEYVKEGVQETSQQVSDYAQDLKKDTDEKVKYAEDKAFDVKESLKLLHGYQDFQLGKEEQVKKPTIEQPIAHKEIPANINADVLQSVNYNFDKEISELKEKIDNLNNKNEEC